MSGVERSYDPCRKKKCTSSYLDCGEPTSRLYRAVAIIAENRDVVFPTRLFTQKRKCSERELLGAPAGITSARRRFFVLRGEGEDARARVCLIRDRDQGCRR